MGKPIEEMTPEEIRVEIAHLRGWTDLYNYHFLGSIEIRGTKPGSSTVSDEIPAWSTGIADAFELVEDMKNSYFMLVRTNDSHWSPAPFGEMHWECRFYAPQKGEFFASTAPMAICKSYLFWKRVQVKNEQSN